MPFDGLVLYALTDELSKQLLGLRIEKIYMPEAQELVFGFRNKIQLFISINSAQPRVHLTEERFQNPISPPMLCMLLRKHLMGARIIAIEQSGLDRILTLTFEATNDFGDKTIKSLIIEIMGKHSNAILIDTETHHIIDAIKRVSPFMSIREIYPGMTLKPLTGDKLNLMALQDDQMLEGISTSALSTDKWLMSKYEGFSPVVIKGICRLASIDAKEPVATLRPDERMALEETLVDLKQTLVHKRFKPTLYTLEKTVDFHVLPQNLYLDIQEKREFTTISDMVKHFATLHQQSNRIQQKALHLNKLLSTRIEKFYLKIDHLLGDLENAHAADRFQLYGELITANLYRTEKTMNQISVLNYYTNEDIVIPLDIKRTPIENAQLYYKKYQKSKKAKLEIQTQLNEAKEEIKYLEQVLTLLENAQDFQTIELIADELKESGYIKKHYEKKTAKKAASKPMHFMSTTGASIFVGKNNLQNDQLTLKDADRHDIWLHTKIIPGSHVIIKTMGKPIDDATLKEAATLAASFSKAKNGSNVEVDYTEVKNVKKPSGAKPGMVIYDHYKTAVVDPDLGLIEKLKKV
jgi:predicted ribosome quality control (RQC) complex YloA/Tae2 family protein